MYYYQHNIGDFDKATRHLTRIERSIYRDLIELYYDTEMQLNADIKHLCRKILANSNEEVTAVEQVLNEFFTLTPNGWYHDRCEEEIERFKSFNSQRSLAGKKSAAARQEKRQRALNGCSTSEQREVNEAATNQKPETIKQEPLKDLVDSVESPVVKNDFLSDLFEKFWKHYTPAQGKQGKQAAKKAFDKFLKGKSEGQSRFWMNLMLSYYMDCRERQVVGYDHLHASTYINQKRWEDSPEFMAEFKAEWIKDNG